MPELDREGLSKHFEMLTVENNAEKQLDSMIKDLSNLEDCNAETVVKDNIERANRILDQVEEELNSGNFSARMVEVASKMIDSITNAASQIQTTSYNNNYLQLREKLIQLKKMDLEFRISNLNKGNNSPRIGSQNIILADRESVLKFLKGGDKNVKPYKGEPDDE